MNPKKLVILGAVVLIASLLVFSLIFAKEKDREKMVIKIEDDSEEGKEIVVDDEADLETLKQQLRELGYID